MLLDYKCINGSCRKVTEKYFKSLTVKPEEIQCPSCFGRAFKLVPKANVSMGLSFKKSADGSVTIEDMYSEHYVNSLNSRTVDDEQAKFRRETDSDPITKEMINSAVWGTAK